ncbi:ABC transporter substrate-binding protein [Flammeovirga yaeyamensis]|uniref:ABC transporter substrate-binding protein n=1 Tax=Flammeovirga yaeyamensis TaxID=367791 RepID=A0AAX1N3E4_9BACT|nr:ABC transporter substrate-binding protein [Flammeovirga yaeyamensis]MBB3696042.1 iron complex transport system substrate-binding protein [Flammeovirga yaeyamensis]NMF34728.1 ABC transporter substrate-binding protein [Flammeovirga yaeyamensis]QWG00443.1 ABC transporter substrate-binding protein [Flammeovirga yaeyamensis]
MKRLINVLLFLGALSTVLFSCESHTNKTSKETYQSFTATPLQVKYAKTFSLDYKDDYKVLHLINPFNDKKTSYVLLQKGQSLPTGFTQSQVIRIPISNMITTTTSQTTMMEELDALDAIRGYVDSTYMYSQAIVDRMADGKIITVGYDITDNAEKILMSNADLVMVVGNSSVTAQSFPVIRKAGIPILSNTDWQENDLLGRAEWVKLFGALLNKEKQADALFTSIELKYNDLVKLAKQSDSQPKVITGFPYKGMWSVPGGASYLAKALEQTHVSYPWSETDQTGSIQLDLEAVFAKGKDADYWVNAGTTDNLQQILNKDSRYGQFDAFKNRMVFNHNKRTRGGMASDYWATGNLHPEIVLADLIKIFHPDLLPDHELYFYQKLQ